MTLKPNVALPDGKIEQTIELGGAPEFLAADATGKVYINLMDKNTVAEPPAVMCRDASLGILSSSASDVSLKVQPSP